MNTSTLASSSSSSLLHLKSNPISSSHLRFAPSFHPCVPRHVPFLKLRASSTHHPQASSENRSHPIVEKLKGCAKVAVFIGAVATMVAKSASLPAIAETPATIVEQEQDREKESDEEQSSPLSEFLESNSEAIDALKSLLQLKLENGEDEEALKIVKRLVAAQPAENEWKFLMARLLNEMGETQSARQVFEEILSVNPLSFEALFENAVLMDKSGEGEAVIKRLEEALSIAEEENKSKEARDVKLIIAQIQFLQKNVEESLKLYQDLTKEDPNDFRPYFCRGMIYSLLDRNAEAREQFGKYRELSPKKFDVDGYLRTPLSRMKLFGTDEN
ncbi:hypothetical protein UlMin_041467 [Ulmus minor]